MKNGKENIEIIYVGDPMCSWCWGIAPHLKKLKEHFIPQNLTFRIVVGGLRPGGGEEWDDNMKQFLRHHWEEVNERSKQPFGYKLFDKETFNYDTEPACRAIVAARPLVLEKELDFFEAVQYKFYVESEDPADPDFYKEICEKFPIDYAKFLGLFESETVRQDTYQEFTINRQWGVRGYPTVLLLKNKELYLITNGYTVFENMKERIEELSI